MNQFVAWKASATRTLATTAAPVAGRLQAEAPVGIVGLDGIGADVRKAPFELLGPGDVIALTANTIRRRFPLPGVRDAEETKAVLVELEPLDLPWRYTPELGVARSVVLSDPQGSAESGTGVRPWLVLVVGTTGQLSVAGGKAMITTPVQAAHQLTESWRWAHIHKVDGHPDIARILSPCILEPQSAYVAALVPAFVVDDTGLVHDAWTGKADVTIPCFDSWTFGTGPEGDFHVLAARLRAVLPDDVGPSFGRATVIYLPRGVGHAAEPLATEGALRRAPSPPGQAGPQEAEASAEPSGWIQDEVTRLSAPIAPPADVADRWILTAPVYWEPFRDAPAPIVAGAWSGQLTADPRIRGDAGLGGWAAIEWQDRISAAAVTKAGDLGIARGRIANLALGLEAAKSLWTRRVPPEGDPVGRLATLGAVLGRLPAADGGTVLDTIAARTPMLGRALWSSAARRALRPGPARSHWAASPTTPFAQALVAANQCPPDARNEDDPTAAPLGDPPKPEGARAAASAAAEAGLRRAEAAGTPDAVLGELKGFMEDIVLRAGQGEGRLSWLVDALDAMDPADSLPDLDSLGAILHQDTGGDGPDVRESVMQVAGTLSHLSPRRCDPLNLEELGRRVAAAVDPTVERPVVVDRVLGTLFGVKGLGLVEVEPEVDIPLWSFLSGRSPDWLLPGVGDLEEHRVVGLSTNPGFVDAFLVGANVRTLGELRWRNLPIKSGWSPLRKFWQRSSGALDIIPIRQWSDGSPLGAGGLHPKGLETEVVVVFRTPLFRRYPATVVYLCPNTTGWELPADGPPIEATKVDPSFSGTIGPDIVFFGFPIPPAQMHEYWVVLEEPPAGYRFYGEKPWVDNGKQRATAAGYAFETFADPVRVMIADLMAAG